MSRDSEGNMKFIYMLEDALHEIKILKILLKKIPHNSKKVKNSSFLANITHWEWFLLKYNRKNIKEKNFKIIFKKKSFVFIWPCLKDHITANIDPI